MVLLKTEMHNWVRRLLWSGAAALLMTLVGSAPVDMGTAWSLALASILAVDMAEDAGKEIAQRMIIAFLAMLPAMLALSVMRGLLGFTN
jgi:hypothetical protein